jgi:hypothetical protein
LGSPGVVVDDPGYDETDVIVGPDGHTGVTCGHRVGWERVLATGSRPFSSERVVETSHAVRLRVTNLKRRRVTLFAQGHP